MIWLIGLIPLFIILLMSVMVSVIVIVASVRFFIDFLKAVFYLFVKEDDKETTE